MSFEITIISDKSDPSPLGESVREELNRCCSQTGADLTFYQVQTEDLHHCVGCFGCWVKTPGICAFNDTGRDICKSLIRSDLAVFIAPVKYGCYSPAIRRVWDRMIPIILPFFMKIGREVHHMPRYNKYPRLVVIGTGENISAAEAETFKALTDANALNFHAGEARTFICRSQSDIAATTRSLNAYLRKCGLYSGGKAVES